MVSPMISLRGSMAENNSLIKPSNTPNALGKALGKSRDNNDNLFMLSHNDKLAKDENSFQNDSVDQMMQRGKTTNQNLRYKNHENSESMEKEVHSQMTEIVRSKSKGVSRKDTKAAGANNGLENMPEHNLAKRR